MPVDSIRISLKLFLISLLLAACQIGVNQKSVQPSPITAIPEELNGPLPPYIYDVLVPEPGSSISLDEYRDGNHYPPGAHPSPGGAKNSICAHVSLGPLITFDDDWTSVQVDVNIDGIKAEKYEDIFLMLGEIIQMDEAGNVIASKPAGPLVLCWPVELGVDNHIAKIEVQKSNGEWLSYGWSFEITSEKTVK